MKQKLRLHLAETIDFSPKVFQLLIDNFELTTGEIDRDQLPKILGEVDIFWFRLNYKIDRESVPKLTRCKYLVTPVTGIDHIDERACTEAGMEIICLRGEKEFLKEVRATAEHTILLTLALLRNVFGAIQHTKSGSWNRDRFRGREIYKSRVGIIGMGRLGEITADYFNVLGAEVSFYDPFVCNKSFKKWSSLEECIHNNDIVSLHLSLTENNRHLLNRQILERFRPDQLLINTSRGQFIDEHALYNCLVDGRIGGAAIDVIENEPALKESPLFKYYQRSEACNLVVTPHIGGCTFESSEKTESFIYDKLLNRLKEKNLYEW